MAAWLLTVAVTGRAEDSGPPKLPATVRVPLRLTVVNSFALFTANVSTGRNPVVCCSSSIPTYKAAWRGGLSHGGPCGEPDGLAPVATGNPLQRSFDTCSLAPRAPFQGML